MAATGAVSVRRTRGPRATGRKPFCSARAISSALRPPSGPIIRATLAGLSVLQPFRYGHDRQDVRDLCAAALFGGADGDLLPVAQAFFFPVAFEFYVGAFGGEGGDGGYAHFHGFLYGVVHAVALGQGLAQDDGQGRFGGVGLGAFDGYGDVLFAGLGDGGGVVFTVAIEQAQLMAGLHAQYPAYVVGGVVVEFTRAAGVQGAVGVDSGNAHGQPLTAISMPSVATWARCRIWSSVIT